MEQVFIRKASKQYGFRRGDIFPVVRNINGEMVVIRNEKTPNNILPQSELESFGILFSEEEAAAEQKITGVA